MPNSSQQGWSYKKLNELGLVRRGKSKHRPRNEPSLYGGKYPFFQTGDIKAADLYLWQYTQTYSEKGLAQSKLWQPGTLCITIAANIAETAILAIEGCFPDSVVGFVADPQKADVRFIKYYIDTIKRNMQSISRGTTQDNLSVEKLLSFDFFVPEVETQCRIADILSAYDDLIENNTRRIAELETAAAALYREWFVELRFPGHEEVEWVEAEGVRLPRGWEVKPIGEVVETTGGGTPSTQNPEYWEGGNIVWYVPSDLTATNSMFIFDSGKHITPLGLQKSSARLFPSYSVMMTSRATIGVTAINTTEACTNQGFITCIPNARISAYQILFWIEENLPQILTLASGATFKEITKTTFRELPILVPSQSIADKFLEVSSPIGRQIETLLRKNELLREARDLLLPRLISGELDVSELELSPDVSA